MSQAEHPQHQHDQCTPASDDATMAFTACFFVSSCCRQLTGVACHMEMSNTSFSRLSCSRSWRLETHVVSASRTAVKYSTCSSSFDPNAFSLMRRICSTKLHRNTAYFEKSKAEQLPPSSPHLKGHARHIFNSTGLSWRSASMILLINPPQPWEKAFKVQKALTSCKMLV